MPTNNQEKWEERFDKEFVAPGGYIDNENVPPDYIKSFIRQEIRQAKIEVAQEIEKIWDRTAYNVDFSIQLKKLISNLKNNDNNENTSGK